MEFYVAIISTAANEEFLQIVKHYKDMRDGAVQAKVPVVKVNKTLAVEFAKFKSK